MVDASSRPRARRFDGRDGLILIAATVAGPLALYLAHIVNPPPILPPAPWTMGTLPEEPPPPSPIPGFDTVHRGIEVARSLLTAWTAAFLIIRLRRPRPAWRRLWRQPGLAACGVGAVVQVVLLGGHLLRWAAVWLWWAGDRLRAGQSLSIHSDWTPLDDLWSSIQAGLYQSGATAHGIAGAWLIMALGDWWRTERSWIDRLGRTLGIAWIVFMVVTRVLMGGYVEW